MQTMQLLQLLPGISTGSRPSTHPVTPPTPAAAQDCGPWVHSNTDESASWRPIAQIREKQVRAAVGGAGGLLAPEA